MGEKPGRWGMDSKLGRSHSCPFCSSNRHELKSTKPPAEQLQGLPAPLFWMGKQRVLTEVPSCRRWSCEIYLVEPLSHQQWEHEVTMACPRFCSSVISFHMQELLWLGRPLTRLLVLLLFQAWHRNESLWCLGWWWAFLGFWFWCKKLHLWHL